MYTYDLVPVLRRDTLMRTLELFATVKTEGVLERIFGPVEPERLETLKEASKRVEEETPARMLERLNIHVRVGDARSSELPEHSVDLIFSTVVFEHIGADILRGLLAEFGRIAKPDAVMSHYVGLFDQYASFDPSITPFNFYKYSNRQWSFLNNPVVPLSRLRPADYRELFRQTGWTIVKEVNTSGSADDLAKIRLAPKFAGYSMDDLLVLFSWLVARPC